MDLNEQPPSGFVYKPLAPGVDGKGTSIFDGIVHSLRNPRPKISNPALRWKILSLMFLVLLLVVSASALVYFTLNVPGSVEIASPELELRYPAPDGSIVTSIDFGSVPVDGTSDPFLYELHNIGDSNCYGWFTVVIPSPWDLAWQDPSGTWQGYVSGTKTFIANIFAHTSEPIGFKITNGGASTGATLNFVFTAEDT